MKQVIVLSGISGSGKSTYARKLLAEKEPSSKFRDGGRYGDNAVIVSADDYFMEKWQEGGEEKSEYKFVASLLTEAHGGCFRDFLEQVESGTELIVVDNSNTETWELAPYVLGAAAFGYECEIVTIVCDGMKVNESFYRNVHNVPIRAVYLQAERINRRVLPRHWKESRIPFVRA